jgi:hypothetical protein
MRRGGEEKGERRMREGRGRYERETERRASLSLMKP